MTTIIQNKFDGGQAEDIRTTQTNQCEFSKNFDIFTNPHKLIPIRGSVDETASSGAMNDIQLSDVGQCVIAGTLYNVAVGYTSSSSVAPSFYTRASGTYNGAWSLQATGTGTYEKATLVIYKKQAYIVSNNSSTSYSLLRFNGASSITTIGTITVPASSGVSGYSVARPFVHPEDNVLYMIVGNVIAKWDGTTFSSVSTILPADYQASSITNYGTYLAIGMTPLITGQTKTFLWGRDFSLNTLQGVIDFGDGGLILENINDQLLGIVYSSELDNRIDIKVYNGSVTTLKSIIDDGSSFIVHTKNRNKLYFGSSQTNSLWVVYKNKAGFWVVTKERYVYNGSTSTADLMINLAGLNVIDGYFYIAWIDNVGNKRLRATSTNSSALIETSIYKTTINTGMPIADRYKNKQLEAVQISYTGASSGTTALKYSVDGSTFTTIISESNTTGEQVFEATNENDGTPFLSGREFQFQLESSGGSEIKEIRYKYKVLPTTI